MSQLDTLIMNSLTGIEIALLEMNANQRRDGEFTVFDFILELANDGQLVTYNAADKRLRRMAEKKLLKYRLVPVNGYHTRVYSKY